MRILRLLSLGGLLALSSITQADTVGTAFTYQGELMTENTRATGTYDFQFGLFDAESNGGSVGTAIQIEDVAVNNGVFTIELDFGMSPFTGQQLWLEIDVRDGASDGAYTDLSPRQAVSPTPFALFALSGNAGPKGDTGEQGPAGLSGYERLTETCVDTYYCQLSCTTGKKVIGGGCKTASWSQTLWWNGPNDSGEGWICGHRQDELATMTAWLMCAYVE